MFFDRLAKGSNEKDRTKELNTTGKDNGSVKNSIVVINGKQMPDTDTKDVIISDSAPIRVNVNLKMGVQPIKTPDEIKWMLKDGYDLSDIPEPWYRIACYMQQFCSFYRSKNKKDLLQIQPACDLFYIFKYADCIQMEKFETKDRDEYAWKTIEGGYDPDSDVNVTSCVAARIEKWNQKSLLKNRRFKAVNRKKDGLVHEYITLRSCSKETEPRCYLARNCKFCLANIASYINYLRKTDPEEEKRQRMKYAAKATKTYQDMEALPFHFSDDFLVKLKVPSASLRFAKRMIDMGAVLPHATLKVTEGVYRLVLDYPPCLEYLFSKDYKGEFSEEHLLKICEGKPLVPYYFLRAITIPNNGIEQDEFFLNVFNGHMIDNVAMLICLVTVDNIRRNISSFFSWLEEEDYILKSPMRRIHKIKTKQQVKEIISDEAIERLRDHCKCNRDLAMIDLLYSTGIRVGELVNLNITDINFEERECVVFGKGDKERKVYFDAKAKLHLQDYLKSRTDSNPALFVTLDAPFERLRISGVEIRVRELGRSINLEKIHPHKFRRTMATRAIDKGMPIEQVQKILGHAQIDTTMQYAIVNQTNVKTSHQKFIA